MAREGHFLKKKWLGPFLEEKMAGESYGGCSWMYKIIQKRWPEYILEYMLKDVERCRLGEQSNGNAF